MRALAEFVMRGRPQAIGVATAAAILPLMQWLSTSVVSLVILRRGVQEGMLVLAWALLPTGILFYLTKNPSSLIALFGTAIMAYVLRITLSWELTLIAAVVIGAVGGWILEFFASEQLAAFAAAYLELMSANGLVEQSVEDTKVILAGFFAVGQIYAMIMFLALSRWWQSALYNPGGFGEEFHQLRLSPQLSLGLVVMMILFYAIGDVNITRYIPLVTVPLLVAGVGFSHWYMARRQLSGGWVFMFYAALILLFQFFYPLLASLALMDSWFNLRQKLQGGPPTPPDPE